MKNDYLIALVEDINDKFDFVIETIVPDIRSLKQDVAVLKTDIAEVKIDIRSLKVWYQDHEVRLVRLETA